MTVFMLEKSAMGVLLTEDNMTQASQMADDFLTAVKERIAEELLKYTECEGMMLSVKVKAVLKEKFPK
jgi:ABC-type branched-subunit amino acid transport system ATPase component